ncbi:MAG TPA: dihydrodipicolinate reductase C-terminal domain-containing protein [Devosia sp.]|jgi:4-hydroxy-tetrahydrodipicolinate reductase|uniref:dihydrodipicolinate reductase C-terminal domain-containing protein n=1 Tax=Devosia sp. TaxID=1871048 RepID=UPI002DDD7D00|nr:dihydrodipicolinate reductase C-terminal domain-containing protein [Devosia sp.]HEV2515395.1 dihydrodipicolinate reductase C-terminal domain-containing protein [Devosia sp.]
MRIAVFGASGRVGTRLVEAILADPGLELAAAHVSPGSEWIGRQVANTVIEYRPAETTINAHCDAIIDFSTPAGSLYLQRVAGRSRVPIVIGTTGFTAGQLGEIDAAARYRPILMGANFALGFVAFARSVQAFALAHPGANVIIEETYHQRKKRLASATSMLLAKSIHAAQSSGAGAMPPEPDIRIHRTGDTVGINEVRFDLGDSEMRFNFSVRTIGAYAHGAVAAAVRLVEGGIGPGRHDALDV